jgi:catalase
VTNSGLQGRREWTRFVIALLGLSAMDMPPLSSYATVSYFGVNTFKFTNAEGAVMFGRYQITAGEQSLTEAEVENAGRDYLSKEIRERISLDPVGFRLLLQIAE